MNWTPEALAAAARMKREGHSFSEIAERFGVSRSAIGGIAKRSRAMFPSETPGAKTAARTKAPARFQWTDALKAQAVRMKEERRSARAIGRRLGCSASCVTKMMAANPFLFPERKAAKVAKPSPRLAGLALPKPRAADGGEKPSGTQRDLSAHALSGVKAKTLLSVGYCECRFPVGGMDAPTGPDMPVCGAPAEEGASWCPAHCDVVFVRRDAA